ncbi:MAG: DUF924 domain-containing protein [Comamonadaceae bacterium]|nr:MAG: DUF924 domain-containing protein [Comamonadaceae bacterium]
MPKELPSADDVTTFWRHAGPARWFKRNDGFDAEFKARFEAAHIAAAHGVLDFWAESAEGALALLVLLDQFPRNGYRGSARSFATDAQARAVATKAIAAGHDQLIEPALRPFFYLPFMHSESLADQERSVALNDGLDANTRRFAVLHHDIVARFGRFPHRNEVLGRAPTSAEERFLAEGGFSG